MAKTQSSKKWWHLFVPGILSLITCLTYRPSLHYDFQFDDIANIPKSFYIRHNTFWNQWFLGSRWISSWLNATLYGIGNFDPFYYRLANLIIHCINGCLVFFLVLKILQHARAKSFFNKHASGLAGMTCALFLLHPVQTQTVTYICQGQLEGLACMGMLAMALTFLELCYTTSYIKKTTLCIALVCITAFSCSTKEIAIISPALLLLLDWFFVAQGSRDCLKKRIVLHGLIFFVVVAIYAWYLKPSFFTSILSLNMQAKNNVGNVITQSAQEAIRPWPFFISQFKVIMHYLWIFMWPFNISVEYDWKLCSSFFSPDCILPLMFLIGLALGIFRMLYTNRTHVIAFGGLWFFICIAPRSSIIPSPELLVDYKTYTASIGWLLILACGLLKLFEYILSLIKENYRSMFYSAQGRIAFSGLCIIPLCLMTAQRNHVWSSGAEFWMNVIQNAPEKARAYNNYAIELTQKHNRHQEAIAYFKKATRIDKSYADPWNNMAVCYMNLNDTDHAIQALRKSLSINPCYAEGYNNLGSLYLQKRDYQTSLECLNLALRIRPHYGKAYMNIARVYAELNEPKKTLEALKNACTIADLDNETGFTAYAHTALQHQEYNEAIWGYQKALSCNPHNAELQFTLANAFFGAQKTKEARNIYKKLMAKNQHDLRIQFNLGDTYLLEEKYTKALHYFKGIEHQWQLMPQIRLRLAQCYEKTDNLQAALSELHFVAHNAQPGHIRDTAQQLLAKLEEHYGDQSLV